MKIGTFFSQIDMAIDNGEIEVHNEAFEKLVPMGLSFVDVQASVLEDKYNPSELLNMLKSNAIEVASIYHLMNFEHKREKILQILKEDTKMRLEHCAQLECKIIMPVPTIADEHPTNEARVECQKMIIEYLNDVVEKSKAYGITTVLENFSDSKSTFATIHDIQTILDNAPDVSYVLDTGNFWFNDNDVLCACDTFKEKIKHVHLKDITPRKGGYLNINGKSCDSNELGSGLIPFRLIFEKLKEYGYDATATVEINDPTGIIEKTIRSVEYLNKIGTI